MDDQRRSIYRKSYHQNKVRQIIPLVVIGVGLIILGLVIAKYTLASQSLDEYTVIPSKVDFQAPDLFLNNLNGDKVSLSDYRKQVVLINNWATWCPPCRAEMSTLSKYYKKYNEKGFTLIGINAGDTSEQVTKFINEFGLTFPMLLDPNNKSLIAFHNDSLPSSYVIDRTGHVVLAWTGPISQEMLEKYVTPLLEQ